MRVSVPGIPRAILDAKPSLSIQSLVEATEILTDFIKSGNIAVLTGAGVSVDSGIRAYRGEDGRYMNPDYKYIKVAPIIYKYYWLICHFKTYILSRTCRSN